MDRTGPVHALVSAQAWRDFAGLVAGAAPGVRFWTVDDAGVVRDARDGREAARTPPLEVAWLSNDVFRSPVLGHMRALIQEGPHMRWVQSGAAGTDGPLFEDMIARGIRLTPSHVTAVPIAEYVLAAVLHRYQQPWRRAEDQAAGLWRHHDFREVAGTTWLLLGMGAIGTEVAVRARTFGARVIGVRRTPRGDEPCDEILTPERFPVRVPDADVVVLAAPAGPGTDGIVDAAVLETMRPGAILVNVARGSLVDEKALLAALDGGRPGHAVLDVTATEPLPAGSPLRTHPGVTVTAHLSGGGLGRFRRSAEVFAANLAAYVAGRDAEPA